MGWIRRIKNWFTGGGKTRQGYPARMQAVRWTEGARKSNLKGDKQKTLVIVHQNEEQWPKYPYTKIGARVLREELNLPLFDETGGQKKPRQTVYEEYDPGKIQW